MNGRGIEVLGENLPQRHLVHHKSHLTRPGFVPGSGHVGFVVDKVALGQFPLPILIPPTAPHSPSSIVRGWLHRPVVDDVRSGLSLTALRIIKQNGIETRYT
jgi:hypothetical protein